ncbi:hypothetical protein BIW11_13720 [Tropilaelaps mercedesae]|uniref:Uncharacterized protein n=1 Tax=Tropilaelaps mercedesae TaxID=418985 RepID=A0A1V9X130_9ACAR|nr:hypothetical protein BIW11_13720 [Tropilaelaps mercedesae]
MTTRYMEVQRDQWAVLLQDLWVLAVKRAERPDSSALAVNASGALRSRTNADRVHSDGMIQADVAP